MSNKKLYLIFINPMNIDFRGRYTYEFIFSHTTDVEAGDNWSEPAIGDDMATPPNARFADYVGVLRVDPDSELSLLIEDTKFCMYDAIEDIIALGWEKNEEPTDRSRMVFKFGDELQKVKDVLASADLSLFSSSEYMGA